MKEIRVAVLGCGTVGLELCRVLLNWDVSDHAASGARPVLAGVYTRDWSKRGRSDVPESLRVGCVEALLDLEADVFVELIGGTQLAYSFIRGVLEKGVHVVTANKTLLAERGAELFGLAAQKGVALEYEAAVGGGIPLVAALREGLVANSVDRIVGILNGTSNYILTRMLDDKLSYFNALRMAQEKGLAEQDPTADVGGFDAAQKLILLTRIAFGSWAPMQAVKRRGIEGVTTEDLLLANRLGYSLKPVVMCCRESSGISLFSGPALVSELSLLAGVRANYNAVQFTANLAGEITLTGLGAGGQATASAVVSDIIQVASGRGQTRHRQVNQPLQVVPPLWLKTYFLRWPLQSASEESRIVKEIEAASLHVTQKTLRSHAGKEHLGLIVSGEPDKQSFQKIAERLGRAVPAYYPVL